MPTQTKASEKSSTPASAVRSYKNITLSLSGTFISFPASLLAAAREDSNGFRLSVNAGGVATPVSQFYTADKKEYFTIGQLGRAVEVGDKLIPLTDTELASTKVEGSKGIEITSFVPLAQVDPVFFVKSYVVNPNTDPKKGDPKAGILYKLLLTLMVSKGKVGLAKMFDRDREYNVIIRPTFDGSVLMLHTIYTSAEVRNISVNTAYDVNPDHLDMFGKLVDSLSADFDPKSVVSTTDSKVAALIAKKRGSANTGCLPIFTGKVKWDKNCVGHIRRSNSEAKFLRPKSD
jgi:non-homologous end joining protein Ku